MKRIYLTLMVGAMIAGNVCAQEPVPSSIAASSKPAEKLASGPSSSAAPVAGLCKKD